MKTTLPKTMKAYVLITQHEDNTYTVCAMSGRREVVQQMLVVTPLLRCVGIVAATVVEVVFVPAIELENPYPPRRGELA